MKKVATPEAQQFTLQITKHTAGLVAVVLHSQCDLLRSKYQDSPEWEDWLACDVLTIQRIADDIGQHFLPRTKPSPEEKQQQHQRTKAALAAKKGRGKA